MKISNNLIIQWGTTSRNRYFTFIISFVFPPVVVESTAPGLWSGADSYISYTNCYGVAGYFKSVTATGFDTGFNNNMYTFIAIGV